MVNLFPDLVQHDTSAGRKASWLYMILLSCSMLAAIVFYSVSTASLVKTASNSADFFSLEMYQGTTDCSAWYSCLFQKSTSAEPTVSGLRCDCLSQAGQLSRMTQYPLLPNSVLPSDWCASTNDMEKFHDTLPQLTSSVSTQESIRVLNFFSSQSSCASAPSATSGSGTAYATFAGTSSSSVLADIVTWRTNAYAAIAENSLRLSPDATPNASVVASWLLRDAYLEVGVSASQAAKDVANSAAGLNTAAKSNTIVTLGDLCTGGSSSVNGVTVGASLYWPLVIQVNSRCKEKKSEGEKFLRALDSTYIISSTLLNKDSYLSFHKANRVLQTSLFTTAPSVPGTPDQRSNDDIFVKYGMLSAWDYAEGLDNLQAFYPSYTAGYALAYAEYTQTFVLQYFGEFIDGTTGGTTTCSTGAADTIPACQLTFTETLKSVFPLTDAKRSQNVDSGGFHLRTHDACAQAMLLTLHQAPPPNFARPSSIPRAQAAPPSRQQRTCLRLSRFGTYLAAVHC